MPSVHVIADPIHGLMDFSSSQKEAIKPIIDCRYFQRLRHIKQLGLADLVFPGAVHTRFNHSIGVAFLAKRLATSIEMSEHKKLETIVAGLLHDIGHGPFSHAFEALLICNEGVVPRKVNHEKWTKKFLETMKKEGILKDLDINRLVSFIDHSSKSDFEQADIISSQLDADRLDYLLRDSHFCGVSYGKYDLDWLVRCMLSVPETSKGPRLGIDRKGISSVEQFLMARRLMTKNVYYHRKVHVAENYLGQFLRALSQVCQSTDNSRIDIPQNLYSFLKMSIDFISGKKGEESFVDEAFTLYASLTDFDVWTAARSMMTKSEFPEASQLASRLFERRLPTCYPIRSESFEGASFLIQDYAKTLGENSWKVGIDQKPLKTYKTDKDPILVREENGTTFSIEASSRFFSAFADSPEAVPCFWVDHELHESEGSKRLIESLRVKGYIEKSSSGDELKAKESAA